MLKKKIYQEVNRKRKEKKSTPSTSSTNIEHHILTRQFQQFVYPQ